LTEKLRPRVEGSGLPYSLLAPSILGLSFRLVLALNHTFLVLQYVTL